MPDARVQAVVRGQVVDELNRDLLVAALGLLTDAIPRHDLSAALGEWAKDRGEPLGQILLRNGVIGPDRLRALLSLSESHLIGRLDELRLYLDQWDAGGVTDDVSSKETAPGLNSTLGVTVAPEATVPAESGEVGAGETAPFEGSESGEWARPPVSGDVERFRPIRLHARGGIGQVWVARDGELQRDVALKVIQDRFAGRSDQRARFILEAEITGNLEHPGIVPVYSLGRNAEGRPYYAMRFIRGESLASAIRQFHLRWRGGDLAAGDSESMWGVQFRQLLGRFLDVCDAIDYAHSRGVLHRDLKPANIMLGRYGETLVVDWGLAKVIGKPDILPVAGTEDAEPSLSATGSGSSSGETQPGTMIGTPSYMSPEQARGALDEIGPASDVYSLGATLYDLLTGQVAFQGTETAEVLERVVKGDFRPPRAVMRSVPPQLEAICLKAMALERRRRYDTVRELARDLQHWLADEPVSAYPEGRPQRLGRWLRRHRTWTYAAAAALLGITIAATVGVVVVERGRRREAEARALAETNFNLARRAVEDYFTRVSENTLLKEQDSVDMRRLRGELLKTALEYYREFLKERSGDPKLRRELAEAQFRVGQIMREIGTPDESIAAFDASIAIWEDLRAAAPDALELRAGLGRAYLALGEQFAWIHDFPRAFTALTRSRELLKGLNEAKPADVSYRISLADCDREFGIAEGDGGQPDRGLELLREAESILKGLLSGSPADRGYRKRLADTINAQGFIHHRKGEVTEALKAFREFQALCQALLDDYGSGTKPVSLFNSLALSYFNMGTILYKQDRKKALETFEKSLEYRTALVDAHPSVNDYRDNLAVSLAEVVPFWHEAGRDDEAFAAIRRSVELLEALVDSQPEQPKYHAELGRSLHILGYLYDEGRDNTRALRELERARSEEDRAVTDAPETELYKLYLVDILWNLGEQYVDLGRVPEGLPHYRRAVELSRKNLAAHRGDRDRTLRLADHIENLAAVERSAGQAEAAQQSYTAGVAALEELASETTDSDVQIRRGVLLMGEGTAAADRGLTAEAEELLRRAAEALAPFGSSAKDDQKPRRRFSEALWERVRLLRSTGNGAEAELLEAERRALWQGRPPGELAAVATEETTQAARIGYGRLPVDDRAAAVRRLGLDLAADHLSLAVSLGFRDFASLHKHPDSTLLLSRPDVRLLLDNAQFPADPFEASSVTD
jgi:serine/threonine-protein kinase